MEVRTDSGTEFADVDGSELTDAKFFATVSRGTLVKVQGIWQSTRLLADTVEIAIEDD